MANNSTEKSEFKNSNRNPSKLLFLSIFGQYPQNEKCPRKTSELVLVPSSGFVNTLFMVGYRLNVLLAPSFLIFGY